MKKEDPYYFYEKYSCKMPFLFVLPITESEYSDEMERQRDKSWFFKIQQLEKKSQLLRAQMNILSEKYSLQIRQTKEMASKSYILMKSLYKEE